jgi:quercetin dioxygenase-like cupin family protein
MNESVHLSTAGTGAEYAAPDAVVTVKVGAEHSGAQYELFEIDAPRGPASPPHSESWSKAFYVLQGRILVQAGDQGYDLGPGSSISIPAGTVNTFSVLTPSAKFLAISQTGRMGAFFADIAEATDQAALREITTRHGVTLAELS